MTGQEAKHTRPVAITRLPPAQLPYHFADPLIKENTITCYRTYRRRPRPTRGQWTPDTQAELQRTDEPRHAANYIHHRLHAPVTVIYDVNDDLQNTSYADATWLSARHSRIRDRSHTTCESLWLQVLDFSTGVSNRAVTPETRRHLLLSRVRSF